MITAIGMVLLPLCLWFWRRPTNLLILVMIYSVFAAAAVIVLGGFGVIPPLFPEMLFVACFAVHLINNIRYPAERPVLVLLAPFLLVVVGALISSFIMPRLFQGQVLVWPQKVTSFFVRSPLAPNAGNFTQDMYLLADTLLVVTASLYLTKSGNALEKLMDSYFIASLVVCGIAFWQFLSFNFHIPFPKDFFLSNPGWALLSDQRMGWLTRLTGPFSEPAALSAYMCASLSASAWIIVNHQQRLLHFLTFFGSLLIVLLTTSATGYLTLLVMGAILTLRGLVSSEQKLKRRMTYGVVMVVLFAGVTGSSAALFVPGAMDEAQLVLNETLNKTQSESYQARSTADKDSLNELRATYGLGVGWGSNRSSSLFPGLCASIGIWGIAGLSWFGFVLIANARRAMILTDDRVIHYAIRGSAAAVISLTISAFISGPTISSPDYYLLLAMVIAGTARAQYEYNAQNRRIFSLRLHKIKMVDV